MKSRSWLWTETPTSCWTKPSSHNFSLPHFSTTRNHHKARHNQNRRKTHTSSSESRPEDLHFSHVGLDKIRSGEASGQQGTQHFSIISKTEKHTRGAFVTLGDKQHVSTSQTPLPNFFHVGVLFCPSPSFYSFSPPKIFDPINPGGPAKFFSLI